MESVNRNFMYAYDDDEQQIIVIDSETGERIEERDNRVLSILAHLNEQNDDRRLRRFTLWCAHETNSHIKPMQKKFIEIAEKAIHEDVDQEKLKELYSKSEGQAVATDSVGLRQGSSQAPGFLASRECINPDAYEGAKNTVRYHCLWAEMNHAAKEWREYLEEIGPKISKNTIEEIEQQQVDQLLDLMGENKG
jgi:hypothetical protein